MNGDVEMPITVFIMGSGASASYGAPTFSDFFDNAKKIMSDSKAGVDIGRFEKVIKLHEDEYPLFNIEQFYGLLEMKEELGDDIDLSILKDHILYLISATIEHSLKDGTPESVSNFIRVLERSDATIINFNWDLLFDSLFFRCEEDKSQGINYGVKLSELEDQNSRSPKVKDGDECGQSSLKMLKLHGSLNWLVCPECGDLFFVRRYIVEKSSNHRCDNCKATLEPLIIPPVSTKLIKGKKYKSIKEIWRLAGESLVEADKIYIIGYSFPITDTQFETFFIDSMIKNKHLKEINIVTRRKYGSEKVNFEDRYISIFRHTRHLEKVHFEDYISSEECFKFLAILPNAPLPD